MRDSVLTKRYNDPGLGSSGSHLMLITPYDGNKEMDLIERLQNMQSPVDERRRLVQERVLNKHRVDTEKQYWMERDMVSGGDQVLRKVSSMNDLQKYTQQQHNSRMKRMPKSYLQIHHERIFDDSRSDGSSNVSSRTASSQDNYPQFYIGDQRINRGENSATRVQMESVHPLDQLIARSDSVNRDSYASIHRESQQSWRNYDNQNYDVPNQVVHINSSRSEHPSANRNFARAPVFGPESRSSSVDIGGYRPDRQPVPNIYQDGKIVITMSPGDKILKGKKSAKRDRKISIDSGSSTKSDKTSTKTSKSEKIEIISLPQAPPPNEQQNQPKSDKSHQNQPRSDNSSQNQPRSDKNSQNQPRSDKNSQNQPRSDKNSQNQPRSDKSSQNQPRSDKSSQNQPRSDKNSHNQLRSDKILTQINTNNNVRVDKTVSKAPFSSPPETESRSLSAKAPKVTKNIVNSDKPAVMPQKGENNKKVTNVQRTPPEWYDRVLNGNIDNNGKPVTEPEPPKNNKPSNLPQKTNSTKASDNQKKGSSKPGYKPAVYDSSKKPRQSSLRKSSSFKVGASSNFFGYMTIDSARMSPKKKVTFSSEDGDRPGTA